MMIKTSASQLASYFENRIAENGEAITDLKLQKLLYYAQAWSLAIYDIPIFGERIEAWIQGPVVPSVYMDYERHKSESTSSSDSIVFLPYIVRSHLDEILLAYGGSNSDDLDRLTQKEDPWIDARKGLAPNEVSHNEIRCEDIKAHYQAKLKVYA